MPFGMSLVALVWLASPADPSASLDEGARARMESPDDEAAEAEREEAPRRKQRRGQRDRSGGGDYDRGYDRGEQLGDVASSGFLWFCVGFLCSPMFFPLGCLLINGYALLGGVDTPIPEAGWSPEEAEGFEDGYSEEVSDARFYGALTGTGLAAGLAAGGVVLGVVGFGAVAAVGLILGGL